MSEGTILNQLSQKAVRALVLIEENWERRGYAPSVRELSTRLEAPSKSEVQRYLESLERENLIEITRLKSGAPIERMTRLTDRGKKALGAYRSRFAPIDTMEVSDWARQGG